MKTLAGNIILYLPEKLPATIQAIIHQNKRWANYEITSDFPLNFTDAKNHAENKKGKSFTIREGEINNGGELIKLETWGGDLRIKKLP